MAVVGKALTATRKVGHIYRLGTRLYNTGMYPFKSINFFMQTPLMALDVIMIGEVYISNGDAKWWHISNTTDDAETLAKGLINRNK